MDNFFVLLLFLGGVGAVVGAATNYLAIKMLFRPYKPMYLFRFRLPLTPGLIPKRRDLLAIQLGKTVSEYLLTPATIKKKFLTPQVRETVEQFAIEKIEQQLLTDDKSIYDWLKLAGFQQLPEQIEQTSDRFVASQAERLLHTLSSKTIGEVMPKTIEVTLNEKMNAISTQILGKAEAYFLSSEGTQTIKGMLDDFLLSKGSFGGMIQMFVGDGSALVEKIQRELVKFFRAPGTEDILNHLIETEWEKLKNRHAVEFIKDVNVDSIVEDVQRYVKKELAVEERLAHPISYYWPNGRTWVRTNLMPKLMDKGFSLAEEKLEDVLIRLNLQEVVREQVDTYPIAKLEELVLGIISRELRLITWLGGIIGGLVGIIQAVIMVLTN